MTDSTSGTARTSAAPSATVVPQKFETTCCIAGGGSAGMDCGIFAGTYGGGRIRT